MSRPDTSGGSKLLSVWAFWCRLVEWSWFLVGKVVAKCRGRSAGLSPAVRERVIDLIEGDLECLIEDLSVKPLADQSVEEMLRNRDVLVWLRGGPLPDEGAVELLETNLAVFFRAPATDEEANAAALRAALDELRRAQAVARAAGDFWSDRDAEASGFTQRERSRLGDRLDDLRKAKGMTVGNLAERSGVDVVTIVATIYGADEVGTLDLMYLAGALEVEPRELFPECSGSAEDEEEGNRPSGPSDGPGGDS